jgi:DNA polymerase-1
MPLLPAWEKHLEELVTAERPLAARYHMPRSPAFYACRIVFVSAPSEAEAMVELASQRQLAWIGVDTEFQYTRPGIPIGKRHTVYDPRSIRPLLLSLSMAEPDGEQGGKLYNFVIDLRKSELHPAVQAIFRLPCTFVGFYAQVELFCLWQLHIREPIIFWDSWAHERALYLGRGHKRYKLKPGSDEVDQARIKEETDEAEEFSYSLMATCQRYGIDHPFAGDKERLQHSFLMHDCGAPFSEEQIKYAASDAIVAARLYPAQVVRATTSGILHHLNTVEMPWVVTNTRMVWNGVCVNSAACVRIGQACVRHLESLKPRLEAYGITNVNSHRQLKDFFARQGLLELFRHGGRFSFDKKQLEAFEDRHPAIPLIRSAKRVLDLQSEKILTGEFIGADERVHPEHRNLGTHTGRQTSTHPNILGLGRIFRPLIIAAPGCGIGEVDLCQIEVGIAAAIYHDADLVKMFNSGDVYCAMARYFYRDKLTEEDRLLADSPFKKRHSELRDRMKTCTLGIIYGLTPHGIALRMKVSRIDAAALQERFMAMFPVLSAALAREPSFGGMRGYASTVSGLRRHRQVTGLMLNWERNWMMNHPVQGSAAVVFKVAGNRLDKLYSRYDARLLVPVHDAYVFEAPLKVLREVADLTGRVMCETVQEYFPVLHPRVEINIKRPECWNKDGHADSIDRWIEDPTYTF